MNEPGRKVKGCQVRPATLRLACAVWLSIIFAFTLSAVPAAAQDDPNEPAPPPARVISRDEKIQLTRETGIKSRTVVALALMTARLTAAEKFAQAENYDGLYTELGGFQGILDNTLDFLTRSDNDSDRVLDNFKRFEIGLRSFVPRIEIIRRELPIRYEPYVKSVIKYIRDARSKALEPLFGEPDLRVPNRPINL